MDKWASHRNCISGKFWGGQGPPQNLGHKWGNHRKFEALSNPGSKGPRFRTSHNREACNRWQINQLFRSQNSRSLHPPASTRLTLILQRGLSRLKWMSRICSPHASTAFLLPCPSWAGRGAGLVVTGVVIAAQHATTNELLGS